MRSGMSVIIGVLFLMGGFSWGAPLAIYPGVQWNDDAGNAIAAHGGNLMKVGTTWYWWGENIRIEGGGFGFFTGINCYTSSDFKIWHKVGIVLGPRTSGALSRDNSRVAYRPKVLFNAGTNTYVMILTECNGSGGDGHLVFATSSTPSGNFTYQSWSYAAGGAKTMDMGVYQEGTAAYVLYSDDNNGISIDSLNSTYLSVSKRIAHISNGCEEGPAMVKVNGRYFLINSYCTGWGPNQDHYRSAAGIAGPWSTSPNGNLGNSTTFDSQTGYILTMTGTAGTTYINVADRWTDNTESGATYPWLPLQINGSTMTLTWYNTWYLDLAAGTWSPTNAVADQPAIVEGNLLQVAGLWPAGRPVPIRLALAEPAAVEIAVYTMRGDLLQRIAPGVLSAGDHVVLWDGRDGNGQKAPGGFSVVKATIKEETMIRPMVLWE